VKLVRGKWGDIDFTSINDQVTERALSKCKLQKQIELGRIILYGAEIHWYVIYGYDGTGETLKLLVWNPWNMGSEDIKDYDEYAAPGTDTAIFP
jgi:hypothetical protein